MPTVSNHLSKLLFTFTAIKYIDDNNKGILIQYRIERWLNKTSLLELTAKGKLRNHEQMNRTRPEQKGISNNIVLFKVHSP